VCHPLDTQSFCVFDKKNYNVRLSEEKKQKLIERCLLFGKGYYEVTETWRTHIRYFCSPIMKHKIWIIEWNTKFKLLSVRNIHICRTNPSFSLLSVHTSWSANPIDQLSNLFLAILDLNQNYIMEVRCKLVNQAYITYMRQQITQFYMKLALGNIEVACFEYEELKTINILYNHK
jgi:hypothetical protein